MSNEKQEIINEIIDLMPEFKGREIELKTILDKLMKFQPKAEMDPQFKINLRNKIIKEVSKKKKIVSLPKKLLIYIPGGLTAAAALFMAFTLFIKTESKQNYSIEFSDQIIERNEQNSMDSVLSKGVLENEAPSPDGSVNSTLSPTEEPIITGNEKSSENKNLSTEGEPGIVSLETQSPEHKDKIFGKSQSMPLIQDISAISESNDEIMPLRILKEESSIEPEIIEEEKISIEGDFNTEEFQRIYENDFLKTDNDPVSTFSIDVDTASYSNSRRYLMSGSRPPADAVRIEEMINYFDYGYPAVEGDHPFNLNTALSSCPWNEDNLLLYVGVQGVRKQFEDLPPNNLVFLLDVSGSMSDENKLPLLKKSLELLTKQLRPQDRVSIVVYAGAAGVVLNPTEGNRTETIISAFDHLEAGGSTAGGEGIELAYNLAESTFMENGNNRIIIATDGDFNVGPSSTSETTRMIEEKRDKGIFLTVLGFGMGNYKDSRMEQMADKGNGNYAYIDNIMEAKKVLVQQISSTLFTIASDVKIQIEFNPFYVEEYRLIGYENRVMANQDFNDDKKDAGELGAGHTVTAIYEIVKSDRETSGSDEMKYQDQNLNNTASQSGEIMTIKFRYKNPGEDKSTLIEEPVLYKIKNFSKINNSFRFAASVAQWGLLLRDSAYKGTSSFESVLNIARNSKDYDPYGLKAEFINLVELSQYLD